MFLIYCNEDRSYVIVEENKAIFEDDVKKDDNIQFFHCNKIYTGCVIRRSSKYNSNIINFLAIKSSTYYNYINEEYHCIIITELIVIV